MRCLSDLLTDMDQCASKDCNSRSACMSFRWLRISATQLASVYIDNYTVTIETLITSGTRCSNEIGDTSTIGATV